MCLSPIIRPNPRYGQAHLGYNYLYNCSDSHIEVPCGHCPQCIAMKQSYHIQRAQMEAMECDLWFCTLTYKSDMLDYIDTSTGYKLKCVHLPDLQNMIKRLRAKNFFGMPFKFWAVVEYGGKKHRPHFHLIFSTPKIPGESRAERLAREKRYHDGIFAEWRRNVATTVSKKTGKTIPNTRNPKWVPCSLYKVSYQGGKRRCTYDFHWIDPAVVDSKGKLHDESDVAFYVSKYATKSNKYVDRLKSALKLNLPADEFIPLWSLIRPKILVSKKWGLGATPSEPTRILDHVRAGINRVASDDKYPFPVFINPATGQTFPLCPFYKSRFFTMEDAHTFYYKLTSDKAKLDPSVIANNKPKQMKRGVNNLRGSLCKPNAPDATLGAVREYEDPLTIAQRFQRFHAMQDMINAREQDDPYYTYCPESYDEEYHDEDYLLDDLNDARSLCDMLYCSFDPDSPEFELYERGSEFNPADFDDLPA